MNFALICDASLYGASLGIVDLDNASVCEVYHEFERGCSDAALAVFLERGMNKVGASIRDIKHLVVGAGPGSFTGIRVAVAWAQGFLAGSCEVRWAQVSFVEALCRKCAGERRDEQGKDAHAQLSLVLPSTRDMGYLTQGQETSLVAYADLKSTPTIWIDSLAKAQIPTGPNISKMKIAEAQELAMAQVIEDLLSKQINWSKTGIPQPCYLRKAYVEERHS